jgi:HK97 gp10 family phage protein
MIEFDFKSFSKTVLSEIGDILVDEAKENMNEISNGRVYVIGGKIHIASKAGDSPNNLSGELNSTIRYEVDENILEFGAGNEKVNYAKYLEKGTKNMDARPNYTKTILENKASIDKVVLRAVKENIKFKKA